MNEQDNATITAITARRIWDSRGRPTLECEVELAGGAHGRGIAPAGASMGSREAVELRDGGLRLGGKDVQDALTGLRGEIAPLLIGRSAIDQTGIDAALIALDGTPTKSRLGGNAITAVSFAVLHAAAANRALPLWQHLAGNKPVRMPLPEIQIFGGGVHAGRRVDIQDFMVMAPKAESFAHALEITAEVYLAAGKLMAERGALQGVADEGGYWPVFASNEEALDMLVRAIERAGFTPGDEVHVSLDIAASEFTKDGEYMLGLDGRTLGRDEWLKQLFDWCQRYPILSVEDPCAEDDTEGMRLFTAEVGNRIQVIGDDYLVTNAALVEQAAKDKTCNAVLIKVNQAGTVSEALAALAAGQRAGFGTIVSARSGETEDTTIVDLAVGWDAGQLKVGSFARSERMAKWNEALRIEERLMGGAAARFAGFAGSPLSQIAAL
ncbi:MAG: phosphopyruvate hydratase [Rhodoferax sp.]